MLLFHLSLNQFALLSNAPTGAKQSVLKMNIMFITKNKKKKINDFNHLNVFFSFLFLILLQPILVHLEERKIVQVPNEKNG